MSPCIAEYLTDLLTIFYDDVSEGRLVHYLDPHFASVTATAVACGREEFVPYGTCVVLALAQQHLLTVAA